MTNAEFSKLVGQYQALVYTVCYQLVQDHQTAQDLAQETFLAAYTHMDACPPEHYKPWLARIAANKAKDHLKSAWCRKVGLPGEDAMPETPRPGRSRTAASMAGDRQAQACASKSFMTRQCAPLKHASATVFSTEKDAFVMTMRPSRTGPAAAKISRETFFSIFPCSGQHDTSFASSASKLMHEEGRTTPSFIDISPSSQENL